MAALLDTIDPAPEQVEAVGRLVLELKHARALLGLGVLRLSARQQADLRHAAGELVEATGSREPLRSV